VQTISESTIEALAEAARSAMKFAYVPYSHFQVGAALLGRSGRIYSGCNIENSSYGATNCAERTALFKAVSEGEREFDAIAIVSSAGTATPPCGICRQVMAEFADGDFEIILYNGQTVKTYTLSELFPASFGKDDLK